MGQHHVVSLNARPLRARVGELLLAIGIGTFCIGEIGSLSFFPGRWLAAMPPANDTELMFVSNQKTNNIVVIDAASYKIVKEIKTTRRPRPAMRSIDLEPMARHWTSKNRRAICISSPDERSDIRGPE